MSNTVSSLLALPHSLRVRGLHFLSPTSRSMCRASKCEWKLYKRYQETDQKLCIADFLAKVSGLQEGVHVADVTLVFLSWRANICKLTRWSNLTLSRHHSIHGHVPTRSRRLYRHLHDVLALHDAYLLVLSLLLPTVFRAIHRDVDSGQQHFCQGARPFGDAIAW